MDNKVKTDSQEKIEEFRAALEAARKMQDDWLKYGLNFVELYVDDWSSDWLENWDENEEDNSLEYSLQSSLQYILNFLSSNDSLADTVRNLLSDKSLQEIATELSRCLNFSQQEQKVFGVKSLFADHLSNQVSNQVSNQD
ncbi:MAG: hypothetical protein HC908_18330, partial [Calothrix sp. SM1_7_51]|nr:hypothetical protein [Calothrix sp. SM1_7_51]